MGSVDSFSEAFEGIKAAHREGRLAHGYLIVGAAGGAGGLFAKSIAQLLFCTELEKPCGSCDACRQVAGRKHPDVVWIEPESKGRVIKVEEQVRPLIQQISQTAFCGSWKVGILLQADRLSEGAANAFLKTLEEPPPKTLLILVTDSPQSILPTILSRCHRVVAGAAHEVATGPWKAPLMDLLAAAPPQSMLDGLARAAAMAALLDGERERIGKEVEAELEKQTSEADPEVEKDVVEARVQARVLQVRADFVRTILSWQRDVLALASGGGEGGVIHEDRLDALRRQAAGVDYGGALARVRAVESLNRRFDRNVPELPALEGFVTEAFLQPSLGKVAASRS